MSCRTLPRLILGLITMFATLVDPMASVVHGVVHAAESAHVRDSASGVGVRHDLAGEHDHHAAAITAETPEHDGAHEALHRVAMRDASTMSAWDAMPSPEASGIAVQPSIVARVSPTRSEDRPPDFGLGSRDLARAPPLV